jgi:hypothetical protein
VKTFDEAQALAQALTAQEATRWLEETGEQPTVRQSNADWVLEDSEGEPLCWLAVVRSLNEEGDSHWAVRVEDAGGGRDSVALWVAPGVCFDAS